MRACLAAAFGLLAIAGSARADVPEGTSVIRGTLLEASAGALQVRVPNGQQLDIPLANGAAVVLASPLSRARLAIGQILSVNADEVRLPGGRVLIAGVYIQADPSVAPADRERLTRLFLPASGSTPSRTWSPPGALLPWKGRRSLSRTGTTSPRSSCCPRRGGLNTST